MTPNQAILHAVKNPMTVTVVVRNVYGNETIYPACECSRVFAEIAGTKTLTRHVINQIKALGYSIAVQQPQVSL